MIFKATRNDALVWRIYNAQRTIFLIVDEKLVPQILRGFMDDADSMFFEATSIAPADVMGVQSLEPLRKIHGTPFE